MDIRRYMNYIIIIIIIIIIIGSSSSMKEIHRHNCLVHNCMRDNFTMESYVNNWTIYRVTLIWENKRVVQGPQMVPNLQW